MNSTPLTPTVVSLGSGLNIYTYILFIFVLYNTFTLLIRMFARKLKPVRVYACSRICLSDAEALYSTVVLNLNSNTEIIELVIVFIKQFKYVLRL